MEFSNAKWISHLAFTGLDTEDQTIYERNKLTLSGFSRKVRWTESPSQEHKAKKEHARNTFRPHAVSTPPPDAALGLSTAVHTVNTTSSGSHHTGATVTVTAAPEATLSETSSSQSPFNISPVLFIASLLRGVYCLDWIYGFTSPSLCNSKRLASLFTSATPFDRLLSDFLIGRCDEQI